MAIRDRITEFQNYLTRQIKFSAGNRLLGRVTGAGMGQEITIGTRLTISGTTLSADAQVSDTAYNEATWNGVTGIAPSKNAVRDQFESLAGTIPALTFAGADPNVSAAATATTNFGDGGIVEGGTETIAGVIYTWTAGSLAVANTVKIDGDASTSKNNLIAAINQAAGAGTLYGTGTVANTFVTAAINGGQGVRITAIAAGVGGNALTASSTRGTGWSAMTGGLDSATATHLGQLCKASTAWWQWNGTAWIPRFLLNGKQITRDDANTGYFSLGVDAIGLPTTTPFP